jgi:FkbM family methyltransferase
MAESGNMSAGRMWSFRRWVKEQLLARGIAVSLTPGQFDAAHSRLKALRDRGLDVTSAVDGGAASGDWTRAFKKVFPACNILCVEPLPERQGALADLARSLANIQIAAVALGEAPGTTRLNAHGDQSSLLPDGSGNPFGTAITVQIETLDSLIARLGFPTPDLVKLDLQGGELACLRGAENTLKRAAAVILECSFLEVYRGAPLIAEVFAFMSARGFQCYDVLSLWQRPLDGALAQGDFLFLQGGHPLTRDTRWSLGSTWG